MTRSPLLPRALLALAAALLALLGLEIAGRLLVPPPEAQHGFEPDYELGWALPPSTEMDWRGQPLAVNSLGLRGPEPAPGGSLSLLSVGDSSVFGDGVRQEETFSARLEALLGPDARVHNGGVPGYTCPQSRQAARRFSERLAPPDILLIYSMHSDIRGATLEDAPSPGFGAAGGFGIGRLAAVAGARLRAWRGVSGSPLEDYGRCLEDMVADQAGRGGRSVLIIPVLDADLPGEGRRGRRYTTTEQLKEYRGEMARVARETESPIVDLPTALREAGLTQEEGLLDQVHPSPAGHAAIAEVIAQDLEAAGWAP
jgi:lysophospholipase L1-like esterase